MCRLGLQAAYSTYGHMLSPGRASLACLGMPVTLHAATAR